MRKIINIYLLLILSHQICAQNTTGTDSLLKLIPLAKEDTNAVQLYLKIGSTYEHNNPSTARDYYFKAGELSKKLNFEAGVIKYFINYGSTFIVEGKFDSMLYYNQQALGLAKQMKDSLSIGLALFNIGIAYREMANYEKAIEYCLEGRMIVEAKGNKKLEAQMNDALQILYFARTEYKRAIEFGLKAVSLARELKMKNFLAQALINLSMPYVQTDELKKGVAFLNEALQIAKEMGDLRLEAVATQNLAEVLLKSQDYTQMEVYLLRSMVLYKKIGSVDGEATILRALAVCYLQQRKFLVAKEYAEKGLAICKKNNYKRDEAMTLRVLSSIYYAMNDVENGEKYDRASFTIIELLIKDILSQQSAGLEKKYETQKKEAVIKQLEAEKKVQLISIRQKSVLNYFLIGGAVTLLLISLLSYRTYKQKQKIQQQRISELETRQQLTATEAVLKGEEQERTRLAKDLHDGLGGMLSGIKYSFNTMKGNLIMTPENNQAFERSMDMLDSSIKEMRRVAHNMMPEALVKFGLDTALKDFCNDINQSGAVKVIYQSVGTEGTEIEQTASITIFRIVQELLNNIIKHASATQAIVQLNKMNEQMSITVEDNGKGFNTELLKNSKGIGWANIENRVEFMRGKLDVQSEHGKGTSVHIEMNV